MNRLKVFAILICLPILSLTNCKARSKFVHKDGNKKIVLEFENGKNALEYGKSVKVNFILTNLKAKELIVVGVGVRIIDVTDNILKTEIILLDKPRKDDILNVRAIYGKEKKEQSFKIPIE